MYCTCHKSERVATNEGTKRDLWTESALKTASVVHSEPSKCVIASCRRADLVYQTALTTSTNQTVNTNCFRCICMRLMC